MMMNIQKETPIKPDVIELLKAHHQEMFLHSPPESVHALDEKALHAPNITFFSAREGDQLAGCGALKDHAGEFGEIKAMRTSTRFLRKGVAACLLEAILQEAKDRSYPFVKLETGTMAAFAPARQLYLKYGFAECPPFADYFVDPNSVCMSKQI